MGGDCLCTHSRAAVTHNNVSVLCYRSLDTQVSIEEHTFDMDFYLTQEWLDGRNFSALFSDENLVEQEPDSCDEPRSPARSAPNPHLPSLSPHLPHQTHHCQPRTTITAATPPPPLYHHLTLPQPNHSHDNPTQPAALSPPPPPPPHSTKAVSPHHHHIPPCTLARAI